MIDTIVVPVEMGITKGFSGLAAEGLLRESVATDVWIESWIYSEASGPASPGQQKEPQQSRKRKKQQNPYKQPL